MISQNKNRVQAIKSKFENLGSEPRAHLNKHENNECETECRIKNGGKENKDSNTEITDVGESSDEWSPTSPNPSYLYSKGAIKRTVSDSKKSLTRQTSDPGKKLHRSHAFRCDRSLKIVSPKRHGSCYGRSESGDFTLKMGEKRLSKDKLKRLGNLLEDQMKKDSFTATKSDLNKTEVLECKTEVLEPQNGMTDGGNEVPTPLNSIPDSEVPQHILEQYAKVIKPRKNEEILDKQDTMTDSGVSSETENVDDEKNNKVRKLTSQFEKNDSMDSEKSNLESMVDFCASSDTIKLERKNPHVKITDTLKKALKQPLPVGPPPKKPPRTFTAIPETPEKQKKDTKKMLEKLEQVLQKREAKNQVQNEYDIAEADLSLKKNKYDVAETDLSSKRNEKEESNKKDVEKPSSSLFKKPKEIHYLCTEILDITNRTLLPNQISLNNCFKSLNCAVPTTNSTLSLPYTRLSTGRLSQQFCSCSNDDLNKTKRLSTFSADYCSKCVATDRKSDTFSTFLGEKCSKCQSNDEKHGFKCHLSCKCNERANFFVEKDTEHIYDVPFVSSDDGTLRSFKSTYGTLNHSKSFEDLHLGSKDEDQKIYDIPCEVSRPATPEESTVPTSNIPKITEQIPKNNENPYSQLPRDTQNTEFNEDQFKLFKESSIPRCSKSQEIGSTSAKIVETSPKIIHEEFHKGSKSPEIGKICPRFIVTSSKIIPKETRTGSKSPEIGSTSPKLIETSPKIVETSPKIIYKLSPKDSKSPENENESTSPKIVEAIPKAAEKRVKYREQSSKLEFQKLRQSFEYGFQKTEDRLSKTSGSLKIDLKNGAEKSVNHFSNTNGSIKVDSKKDAEKTVDCKKVADSKIPEICVESIRTDVEKPPMKPKPIFVKNKMSKSSENLLDEINESKRENRFSTNGRKYRKERDASAIKSMPKKDSAQLDVDRENLNRLMSEIYATVSAATAMDNKPSSFPTDREDGSTSEDSVKLTRSLTEKRKNYVRRVSSKAAYLDQKNLRTRYRHQTSVCSYKSEIIDNPYNTFRSWKSFRTSQKNLDKMADKMADKMDRRSTDSKVNLTDSAGNILSMKDEFDSVSVDTIDKGIDEKTGCVDIGLPFEPRERGLFNVCLLVGLNHMTGQAYVKSVFPSQVQIPPHIENLIFPETLSTTQGDWSADAKRAQCYSLVLTDERGERSYGYCRRVLPEGATVCLPLCYCLIGKYRAPGFYYKVLQEIESHHGSSEEEINSILQQLFETDFPGPGEEINITYTSTNQLTRTYKDFNFDLSKSCDFSDISKCKTLPDLRRSLRKDCKNKNKNLKDINPKSQSKSESDNSKVTCQSDVDESQSGKCNDSLRSEFDSLMFRSESASGLQSCDFDNNNATKKIFLSLDRLRTKTIKRPIEPRIDESNMSTLLDSLGAGLTIKVFGSLLLERKVLIVGDHLSQVSSCMEAIQSALYPFVWQQPLISSIPAEIQRDVLEAPLPILAGMLNTGADVDVTGVAFEEGMLIDLTHPSKVLFYQGDESTILPTSSYKTLKTSLQMESKKHDDDDMRNVMISEAFMRFFVDILGDFWRFFSKGELKEGMLGKGGVIFDKESFIKSPSSKQNQFFLEWFAETAIFNHFIQNMAVLYNSNVSDNSLNCMELVDAPLPDFYDLFQQRVNSRKSAKKNVGNEKSNYKFAVNKRVKLLKTKLRELVT